MPANDARRTYYDHEPVYQKIGASGGVGWDDLCKSIDSYDALEEYLNSPFAAFLGPGRTALDLGCGGGQAALMLARRGCVTHGVDFSPMAIALAKANAAEAGLSIDFREGDCLTLKDYADQTMDGVIDNHAWHCLVDAQDRLAFLHAAYRVLKRGGMMFSETMTREGPWLASVPGIDPSTFIDKHHSRYWAAHQEALAQFRLAGFEILYERLKPQKDEPVLLVIYARRP